MKKWITNCFALDRAECKQRCPHWGFSIQKNQVADYFLCLAFDNRESLEPQHVWLIPSGPIQNLLNIRISEKPESLAKWSKYERPLNKVILSCCKLKGEI